MEILSKYKNKIIKKGWGKGARWRTISRIDQWINDSLFSKIGEKRQSCDLATKKKEYRLGRPFTKVIKFE